MLRRVICLHRQKGCLIWSTEEENQLHQRLWKEGQTSVEGRAERATFYTLEGG